jgi:phosphopentomutase
MNRRVVILLLDGVGCGELPDAARFGDTGSNTLANLAAVTELRLPELARLGVGNILPIRGVPPAAQPVACFGKMAERSAGRDSTNGHWEVAGLVTHEPFPAFPQGFPPSFIRHLEESIGHATIGNVAASGTEIIERLGAEHVRSGCPIVYTSADSVLQVACHEQVVPPAELYRICETARRLLAGELRVSRVIARPFVGRPGAYRRTPGRRDYSCPPHGPTLLDRVAAAGGEVVGIGKVDDLFTGRGITRSRHSVDNAECVRFALEELGRVEAGLIFTTLVQFDMDWGHRNDPAGFARGLGDFDRQLPGLLDRLRPDDLLFITADHGNDPTTPSTDHSREHVPILACGPRTRSGVDLGTRPSFADLGQTAARFLGTEPTPDGESFLELLVPPAEVKR